MFFESFFVAFFGCCVFFFLAFFVTFLLRVAFFCFFALLVSFSTVFSTEPHSHVAGLNVFLCFLQIYAQIKESCLINSVRSLVAQNVADW